MRYIVFGKTAELYCVIDTKKYRYVWLDPSSLIDKPDILFGGEYAAVLSCEGGTGLLREPADALREL